jgi:hypothetical protein
MRASCVASIRSIQMVHARLSGQRVGQQLRFGPAAECRMGDRNGCPLPGAHRLYLGLELFRERLDDAGSKSAFRLGEYAIGLPDTIVGDGKLPVCSGNLI